LSRAEDFTRLLFFLIVVLPCQQFADSTAPDWSSSLQHKHGVGTVGAKNLSEQTFPLALSFLANQDPDLARVLAALGPPPLWKRDPGFPTLVHIILEQQVSLASAQAAFTRLGETLPDFTPREFLKLSTEELRRIGFSRQKTRYCRNLAETIMCGSIDLARLNEMDDDTARSALLCISGIGPWTADIYLLMALRRPDVWPVGDLALVNAVQEVKQLTSRPTERELELLSEPWKPWRAVAARILWHHYLSKHP
jgi:DNA-3-methyladenine glycosylase II